jgi:hypothetical protein
MASIGGIGAAFPTYTAQAVVGRSPAAATPAPGAGSAPAQDTVEISSEGAAASKSYLETLLPLLQDSSEQLSILAAQGNTLAAEILSRRTQGQPAVATAARTANPA